MKDSKTIDDNIEEELLKLQKSVDEWCEKHQNALPVYEEKLEESVKKLVKDL